MSNQWNDFYTHKVLHHLARIHADDADPRPLIRWAREWGAAYRADKGPDSFFGGRVRGVIMGENGELLGEYARPERGKTISTDVITKATQERWGCDKTVLDMASRQIARLAGTRVVTISGWDVAAGAPAPEREMPARWVDAPETIPIDELVRNAEKLQEQAGAAAHAVAIEIGRRAAREGSIKTGLIELSGKSRPTVLEWEKAYKDMSE